MTAKTYTYAAKQVGPIIYGLSVGYKLTLTGTATIELTSDIEGAENEIAVWTTVTPDADGVLIITGTTVAARITATAASTLTVEDGDAGDLLQYQQGLSLATAGKAVTAEVDSVTGVLVKTAGSSIVDSSPTPLGNKVLIVGDSYAMDNQLGWYYTAQITSITRSDGVATVVLAAANNAIATGRKVRVVKVPEAGFNGNGYPITFISTSSFSFPCPGDDATATVTTAVIILEDQWAAGTFLWTNLYRKGELTAVCRGITGTTSGEVLASLEANIAEVVPNEVHAVYGANDLTASGYTAQTTIDNDAAIAALCQRYGLPLRLATMCPLGHAFAGFSAANNAKIRQINAARRALPLRYPNVRIADVYEAMVDPLDTTYPGESKAGMLRTDDLHPSVRGYQIYGKAFAETYDAPAVRVGLTSYSEYGATPGSVSVVDSAPWVATGGTAGTGVTGTVGQYITAERTAGSATAVASVPVAESGRYAQQLVITSVGASSFQIRSNNGSSIPARLTAGEKRRLCADVKVSGIDANNFLGLYIEWFFTIGGVTHYRTIGTVGTAGYSPSLDYSGVLISNDEVTVPDPATVSAAGWRAVVQTGGASAAELTVAVGSVGFADF